MIAEPGVRRYVILCKASPPPRKKKAHLMDLLCLPTKI